MEKTHNQVASYTKKKLIQGDDVKQVSGYGLCYRSKTQRVFKNTHLQITQKKK